MLPTGESRPGIGPLPSCGTDASAIGLGAPSASAGATARCEADRKRRPPNIRQEALRQLYPCAPAPPPGYTYQQPAVLQPESTHRLKARLCLRASFRACMTPLNRFGGDGDQPLPIPGALGKVSMFHPAFSRLVRRRENFSPRARRLGVHREDSDTRSTWSHGRVLLCLG